ncbi:MAG: PEP-CTERM sorting domain-containing protein [Planctomycetota bacterium]
MRNLVPIVTLALLCGYSQADTTMFLSFSDLNGPDPISNTVANLEVGQSASAYLWVATDTDISTLTISNVVLTSTSVVAITNAEVFNPTILLNTDNSNVGSRWDQTSVGAIPDSGDSISGLLGFANGVSAGTGILVNQKEGAGTQTDSFFSQAADAFLYARVDFDVIGAGLVDLESSGNYLTGGSVSEFDTSVAQVISVIPEPSTTAVLATAGLVALSRRRR